MDTKMLVLAKMLVLFSGVQVAANFKHWDVFIYLVTGYEWAV